jgi:hypothetical protein
LYQQKFKDTVLQVRRPGGGVTRPYDDELIPPAPETNTRPGVKTSLFEGDFPWVPQLDGMAPSKTGQSPTIDPNVGPKDRNFCVLFSGFLQAPADGTYTLSLAADSGALLRIHDATTIDADFGYSSGREISATIRLKAGKHLFRLYYRHHSGRAPQLSLRWQGPGFDMQTIPAAVFSHAK